MKLAFLSSPAWGVVSFVWATIHDFIYFGAYTLWLRARHLKAKRSADDRLDAIEKHLGLSS